MTGEEAGHPAHPASRSSWIGAVGAVGRFLFGWRAGVSLTICAAVVIFSFLVLEKLTERLVPAAGKAEDPSPAAPPAGHGRRGRASRGRLFRWKGFDPVAGAVGLSVVVLAIGAELWTEKVGERVQEHHSILYGPVNRLLIRLFGAPPVEKLSPGRPRRSGSPTARRPGSRTPR